MFSVKIDAAARQSHVPIEYARDQASALEKAKEGFSLLIVDLNHRTLDPIKLIKAIKAEAGLKLPILGFISHVDVERKQEATKAGCDTVVARSAFSVNLPQILKRHSGTL